MWELIGGQKQKVCYNGHWLFWNLFPSQTRGLYLHLPSAYINICIYANFPFFFYSLSGLHETQNALCSYESIFIA